MTDNKALQYIPNDKHFNIYRYIFQWLCGYAVDSLLKNDAYLQLHNVKDKYIF